MISSIAGGDCRPHTVPELCQKRGEKEKVLTNPHTCSMAYISVSPFILSSSSVSQGAMNGGAVREVIFHSFA